MDFITSNLLPHEKVVSFSRMHWIIFATTVFMFILAMFFLVYSGRPFSAILPFLHWPLHIIASLICLVVALFTGIDAFISYHTSEYGITNKRVLIKTGWISRNSLELFLDKVEAIYVFQSIPGRIFGYGGIRVVGTGGTQDVFFYVPNPLQFRKVTQEQVDQNNRSKNK